MTVSGIRQNNGDQLWTLQLNDGYGFFAKACREDTSSGFVQCLPDF